MGGGTKRRQKKEGLTFPRLRMGRPTLGTAWISVSPHLTTSGIQLTMATRIVRIDTTEQCGHIMSCFMIASLSIGYSVPNYHRNSRIICMGQTVTKKQHF